jgi:hypothetical protein
MCVTQFLNGVGPADDVKLARSSFHRSDHIIICFEIYSRLHRLAALHLLSPRQAKLSYPNMSPLESVFSRAILKSSFSSNHVRNFMWAIQCRTWDWIDTDAQILSFASCCLDIFFLMIPVKPLNDKCAFNALLSPLVWNRHHTNGRLVRNMMQSDKSNMMFIIITSFQVCWTEWGISDDCLRRDITPHWKITLRSHELLERYVFVGHISSWTVKCYQRSQGWRSNSFAIVAGSNLSSIGMHSF